MSQNLIEHEVDHILTLQRDESDARDLLNEVEKINLFEGQHRYRWIWELFQNARDEAGNGVDIICELSHDSFKFFHNGEPFDSKNLLALTRKTSTKPIDGSHGNSGKFGTGFVTTHLLNKKVLITGVHKNIKGKRRFEHRIDRSADTLEAMMLSIAASIDNVRTINSIPPADGDIDSWNCFFYELSESTVPIALGGIEQLEANLDFAMLLNSKVKSVTIISAGVTRVFKIKYQPNVLDDISFFHFDSNQPDLFGILYRKINDLTIGVPVKQDRHGYVLQSLGNRPRLFKDQPLIGTENLSLPMLIHHGDFQPTELRDGVRTRLAANSTEETDIKAAKNRNALKEFAAAFSSLLLSLSKAQISNLHCLAESGTPDNDAYYDRLWHEVEIQKVLRTAILEKPIVKTVSGSMALIKDSFFLSSDVPERDQLYKLVNQFFPDRFPNDDSINDWIRIINQDTNAWPKDIIYDVKKLVDTASDKAKLLSALPDENKRIEWFQGLINHLESTGQERLGIDHAIYPTQSGDFVLQGKVYHDNALDNQFKKVSAGLGRDLEKELLPKMFKAKFVTDFNTESFLSNLNTTIGALDVVKATPNQIQAIIDLCCSFKTDRSEKREQWFDLIHRLLPQQAPQSVRIVLNEEYHWESSEKWCLNYICGLVETSGSIENFTTIYFKGDSNHAFKWLSDLIDFVLRNKENRQASADYEIIPTQDGKFKRYGDKICSESNPSPLAERIKPLYRDYVGTGDPGAFLVHLEIRSERIRSEGLDILSRPVDDLFNSRDAEDWVREGQKYHKLFLALKELMEEFEAEEWFPSFTKRQPVLYIKAFGEGSSLGRLLKLKKTVDEIEKLDKLSLSPEQMKILDDAASEIGNAQSLIDTAREMADIAEQVRWRQNVGKVAEQAFIDALVEAMPELPPLENPDDGKDFVIRIKDKYFSIEIKSAIENRETVKMSMKQGETAQREKKNYALCVISRPARQMTNKEEFKSKAKFVVNIGDQIGDKIEQWRLGMSVMEKDENVSVQLDNKTGFVNIKKATWENNMSFNDFINHLKIHFESNPTTTQ